MRRWSGQRWKVAALNRTEWFSIPKGGRRGEFRIEVSLNETPVEIEDMIEFERLGLQRKSYSRKRRVEGKEGQDKGKGFQVMRLRTSRRRCSKANTREVNGSGRGRGGEEIVIVGSKHLEEVTYTHLDR